MSGVSGKAPYYRGVRGSAALATRPVAADAPAAEALPAGEMRRVPYRGELLGAVRVRASYAPIPLDAFDRAAEALDALEQAAYLQLLRLSVGESRNWCRVAKRGLQERLRLTERRLLRVLDALVAKGFLRPLHRDNRGTLWRVYLPREAFGERLGDEVIVGRADAARPVAVATASPTANATATAASTATRTSTRTSTAARASTSATASPRPRLVHSTATLARALAAARGRVDATAIAAAAREVIDLLAEGQSPDRIAACIETVRRRRERGTPAGERESA